MSASSLTPIRRRYPSDLSDRSWGRVAPALPTAAPRGRPRSANLREIVNGINYRWTTGCAWRMLPHDLPPWETVYGYFRRWTRDGTLRRLRDQILRRSAAPRSSPPSSARQPAAPNPDTQQPSLSAQRELPFAADPPHVAPSDHAVLQPARTPDDREAAPGRHPGT